MKYFYLFNSIVTALMFLVLAGCASAPEEAPPEPPFELTQLVANPPKVEKASAKPMKLITGRVIEITEDRGVQKFLFVKFPTGTRIAIGQEGDIYADPSLAQKIGKFKIIEVFPDLSRALINDLSFKIGKAAMIGFETIDLSKVE